MATTGRRALRGLGACVAMICLAVACAGANDSATGPSGPGAPAEVAETTTTTTAPPRTFTLVATGDIFLHSIPIQQGRTYAKGTAAEFNFNPMFDKVRDLISSADFAICHNEGPLSSTNTDLTKPGSNGHSTKVFNQPHELADAYKNAGYDACDTASNHTWDQGASGVKDTLDVLDKAGIGHSGSARDQAEADNPPIYDIKGVKVGHLAYSYTIANSGGPNTDVPKGAEVLRSMLWPALGAPGILDMTAKIRARGAQFVVMSVHWGTELQHQPTADQTKLAHDLLTAPGGPDLIIGTHVHVVQPCEKIGDKYVTYGMGNFLSNQSHLMDVSLADENEDGSLQRFTVNEVTPGQFKVTKMEYQPTWVDIPSVANPGHVITPATPTNFPKSYARTVANLNLLGPGTCDATAMS